MSGQGGRRETDCLCGKLLEDRIHNNLDPAYHAEGHVFKPHPPSPPSTDEPRTIRARREHGVWVAVVAAASGVGRGQAASWIDAVQAAMEDLRDR